MNKPRAVFFGNRQDLLTHVYPDSRVERLKALADVHPVIVSKDNFDDSAARAIRDRLHILNLGYASIDASPDQTNVCAQNGVLWRWHCEVFR